MKKHNLKRILISRTDNLGDVMLTLPLLGYLKSQIQDVKIGFIGKNYTKALAETSEYLDVFFSKESLIKQSTSLADFNADVIIFIYPDKNIAKIAKKAKIPLRIATSHRIYNWLYCNKLVNFTRRYSKLHEAQLNFKLLEPLGLDTSISLKQIPSLYGFNKTEKADFVVLDKERFNLILHPKSRGSAREWTLEKYHNLIKKLPKEKYKIFITGTKTEGELIKKEMPCIFDSEHVFDLTGKLTLTELIAFIGQADGLLACSTGPLHIAAALGKYALGIYPPMRPIDPMRWQPLGKKAHYLVKNKPDCTFCKSNQNHCQCIDDIQVLQVYQHISNQVKPVIELNSSNL